MNSQINNKINELVDHNDKLKQQILNKEEQINKLNNSLVNLDKESCDSKNEKNNRNKISEELIEELNALKIK